MKYTVTDPDIKKIAEKKISSTLAYYHIHEKNIKTVLKKISDFSDKIEDTHGFEYYFRLSSRLKDIVETVKKKWRVL